MKGSLADSYLGTGICRCTCGRKLYFKERNERAKYYYCAYQRLKTGEPCHEPMIPYKLLEDALVHDVSELFKDDLFIMARIQESRNAGKIEEKKIAVARFEKEIESLEREKGRVALAIRKAPDVDVILAQLKAVDEEITTAKDKLRTSRLELALVLSDEDMVSLTERITTDFANFPNLDVAGQKDMLTKYVSSIGVDWNREPLKFTPEERAYIASQGRDPDGTGISFMFRMKVDSLEIIRNAENNGSTMKSVSYSS
jgi:hypothetical protein